MERRGKRETRVLCITRAGKSVCSQIGRELTCKLAQQRDVLGRSFRKSDLDFYLFLIEEGGATEDREVG